MREAVRILSLEGLVKRNIHRGIAVAKLSLNDVHAIYRARPAVGDSSDSVCKETRPDLLRQLRTELEQYEKAVRAKDRVDAVNHDVHFHALLIRCLRNNRLKAFYQKTIGELRMGTALVDRRHDDPGILVPVRRKLYQLPLRS